MWRCIRLNHMKLSLYGSKNGQVVQFHTLRPHGCCRWPPFPRKASSTTRNLLGKTPQRCSPPHTHTHTPASRSRFLNLVQFHHIVLYVVSIYSPRLLHAAQLDEHTFCSDSALHGPSSPGKNRPFRKPRSLSEAWGTPSRARVWGSQQWTACWAHKNLSAICKTGSGLPRWPKLICLKLVRIQPQGEQRVLLTPFYRLGNKASIRNNISSLDLSSLSWSIFSEGSVWTFRILHRMSLQFPPLVPIPFSPLLTPLPTCWWGKRTRDAGWMWPHKESSTAPLLW